MIGSQRSANAIEKVPCRKVTGCVAECNPVANASVNAELPVCSDKNGTTLDIVSYVLYMDDVGLVLLEQPIRIVSLEYGRYERRSVFSLHFT